jgi:hypothetical protein
MKFRIAFAIKGHVIVEAADRHEAMRKFDTLDAESMIAEGYDDIDVDEPVPATEKGR